MESPIWMGVSDANMIIFESGSRLFLFTINGLLLQQFDDHEISICNLWVVGTILLPDAYCSDSDSGPLTSAYPFEGFSPCPHHIHG